MWTRQIRKEVTMMELFVVILAILWTNVVLGSNPLLVETDKGLVEGKMERTIDGKEIDIWYSIPFSKPPIGELRFSHPQPMDSWTGIKNVNKPPNSCIQHVDTSLADFEGTAHWLPNTKLSEDCLYLSVFVPKPRPKSATVMVWIYGGGFMTGTSTLDMYNYKTLATEQNVIVVSIQYRVDSFGFLYMGTEDVSGNAGLFDQLMALRWIHNNIANFGGNKDNIVLFGESAGAASVGMHLLSPLSRNLFNRAILQSGSPISPWATKSKELALENSLSIAEHVGCPHKSEDKSELIKCLRSVNSTNFVSNILLSSYASIRFGPVVDGYFLEEMPKMSLDSGKFKNASILLGSNSDEGSVFLTLFFGEIFKTNDNISVTRDQFKDVARKVFSNKTKLVQDSIIHEYTNWINPDDSKFNIHAVEEIVGDTWFKCDINEIAHEYAMFGNDVFMYHFTHRSLQSPWPKWMGVLHGDEIKYVFGYPLTNSNLPTNEEKELSREMMTYWANFAKTGDPSIGRNEVKTKQYWPKYTAFDREYFILDIEMIPPGKGLRLEHCAFWSDYVPLLEKYTGDSAVDCGKLKPTLLTCPESQDSSTNSAPIVSFNIALWILRAILFY